MTSATLFETLDNTREEIVEKMRNAIQKGRKKKLSSTDFQELAIILTGKIIHLNRAKADNKETVKAICDAEIQMLEEGYPQSSLNSKYLPIYTGQVKDAIAQNKIQLTKLNSYPKETSQGVIQKHFALEYLTYPKSIQVVKGVKLSANGQAPLPAIASEQPKTEHDKAPVAKTQQHPSAKAPTPEAVPQNSQQPSQQKLKALEAEIQSLKAENLRLKQENEILKGDRLLLDQLRQVLAEESETPQNSTAQAEVISAANDIEKYQNEEHQNIEEPQAELSSTNHKHASENEEIHAEGRAQSRAAAIFRAIQQWNQKAPDRSFAITQGLLVKTFHINQKAANEFLKTNAHTLQNYHQDINISTLRGHNRKAGRDIDELKMFVEKTSG
ncbi:MAG: protelomerase family protein [Elainellaceae cyanobacterium]